MVTETAPETVTPVSAEPVAPVADAGLTQVPDAAPAPEADPVEAEVDAFLAGGKEGSDAQSPEGATTEELPELKEAKEAAAKAATERVERETAERLQAEADAKAEQESRQQAEAQYRQNYRALVESTGKEVYDLAIEAGYSEADARAKQQAANQRANSLHATGLNLYQPDAVREVGGRLAQGFNDAVWQSLPTQADRDAYFKGADGQPRRYASPAEALQSFREIATKGMISRSEAEAENKASLLRYRRKLEAEGLISGAQSGTRTNGAAPTGGNFASMGALDRAYNSNQIDRATYAREHKRLSGMEP